MNSLEFASKFVGRPLQVKLGQWEINYLSFVKPVNANKVPIVILGGAFQTFHAFKKDVETLMEDFPVYLVDLPGQGGSHQLADNLTFEDYALLLKGFMDRKGIQKISPIALSYGSAIGYHFASKFPERVDKLILGGTTPALRESVKILLEESLEALKKGEMKDFAAGVVLNLLNFSQRDKIEGSEILSKTLYRSIQRLSSFDREKYLHNTLRLLSMSKLPAGPLCETLVLAGEFDNFTTPHECFQVAQKCYHGTFGIVKNTDHLAPYEKRGLVNKIYRKFLKGEKINRIRGFEIFQKDSYPVQKMQIEPRWKVDDIAFLDPGNSKLIPVKILDINSQGIKIYTSFNEHKSMVFNKKFKLVFDEEELEIDLLIFDEDGEGIYRAVFKHCNIDLSKRFEGFIERLASMCEEAIAAA